jgi:hypothetical protein
MLVGGLFIHSLYQPAFWFSKGQFVKLHAPTEFYMNNELSPAILVRTPVLQAGPGYCYLETTRVYTMQGYGCTAHEVGSALRSSTNLGLHNARIQMHMTQTW